MTKELIQKNIKLSIEFDKYIGRNPYTLNSVPRKANVIITSDMDKKLSDANLKIARSSKTGKFVEARKVKRGWKINKIK